MVQIHFGGKQGRSFELQPAEDMIIVRTRRRQPLADTPLTAAAREVLSGFETETRFPTAGVEILASRGAAGAEAREALKVEPEIEFAGRVLTDPTVEARSPVAYTENIFLKLADDVPTDRAEAMIANLPHGLKLKRPLDFARNAYFVESPEGIGLDVFGVAEELLGMPEVELCHPEVVRERAQRQAFPEQWHLDATHIGGHAIDQHANVVAAWNHSRGAGVTIAIIDDGVDTDHPEFAVPGKIVAARDVTLDLPGAKPRSSGNRHGTACAGVATAAGLRGASGVAPDAKLMPIRLQSGLGSMDEAEAFYWAMQNGADIISCSWGPVDGKWWDATDPTHDVYVPLPDNTRLAMDAAADQGRDGRGCVILFAAGNGNESVEKDGYASYDKVIAVAACNDGGTRAAYSDMGESVWCSFPSSNGEPSLTPGIWTTDRSGTFGYNEGSLQKGDLEGYFTNSFGGTSSACPGAAGVAALVIAANPGLSRVEVRDVLKECCDKIDAAGGAYDAGGHSPKYGWGRLNAGRAVELALPVAPAPLAAVVPEPSPPQA